MINNKSLNWIFNKMLHFFEKYFFIFLVSIICLIINWLYLKFFFYSFECFTKKSHQKKPLNFK